MKYESRTRTNAHDWFSLVLVIVGAILRGLIGLQIFVDANWNVVTRLFGSIPVSRQWSICWWASLVCMYFTSHTSSSA